MALAVHSGVRGCDGRWRMMIFWFGLAFLFIAGGLFICTQNTQTVIGVPMVIIGVVILVSLSIPAHGHDRGRPELDGWFMGLHANNKTWCCDGKDTDPIEEWQTRAGGYRVKFRGEWFDVPEGAIVDGPNKSGEALLWMNKGYSGLSVRCFMPGSMT
jgi:hypothetical protein